MEADREVIMNAVSSLGFEVFRNGQFHWNSSDTPDMYINKNGSIHCWTSSPFKEGKNTTGDLIDFLRVINPAQNFIEAKTEAERLTGLTLPSLDTYKDNGYTIDNTNRKTGFIDEEFIKNFEVSRYENFERFKVLLNEALPSLDFDKQKELALKYQIGYIEMSDRLSMPIKDEENRIVTLWKYNKNPNNYINENGIEVTPNKVLFTKGRDRCPFNLYDMQEFRKDLSKEVFLCAGEKDTLNLVGNDFRAVTLGAENSNLEDKYKWLFKDLSIVIAYDNDIAGDKGTVKIYEQLKDVAKDVKVFDWREVEKQGIELRKGYDMTDYLLDLKNTNKEFSRNFKGEEFISELKIKIDEFDKLEREKRVSKNENKNSKKGEFRKMALAEVKGNALFVSADNSLQYVKNNEVLEKQNLTALTGVVREASSVANMNLGDVTVSLQAVDNDNNKVYLNFLVSNENGNIVLRNESNPSDDDLSLLFEQKTNQSGKNYYALNNENNARGLVEALSVSETKDGKKFLGVSVMLNNDDIKQQLQDKKGDYAILSRDGFELRSYNQNKESNKEEKPKVQAYGNFGGNDSSAMDSIRNEMLNSSSETQKSQSSQSSVRKNN